MRNPRTSFLALGLLALALGAACGSAATGITLSIDPDPVPAAAQGDGSYVAAWDAVVADLTGVGGTVEAADVSISGAASVSSLRENPGGFLLPSQNMAVAPFARRLFHQSARFTPVAGQPLQVEVTVRFLDVNGQQHQATAHAPVTLR